MIAKIGAVKMDAEKSFKALEKDYNQKVSIIEKSYQSKINKISVFTLSALLYGLVTTIFTACKSSRIVEDFIQLLAIVWSCVSGIFKFAIKGTEYAWSINKLIPYKYFNAVIGGFLAVTVFCLITGVLYGLICFLLFKGCRLFKEKFFDIQSLIVVLISSSFLVWFADYLLFIEWNLVFIWLLVQVAYITIRVIKTNKTY